MDNSNIFKVRLESYNHGASATPTTSVVFDVMPVINESVTVEYQSIDPVHMPGSYVVYKGTKATTYQLSDVKLLSRNTEEATKNQRFLNTIRGWTKPYFGLGTQNTTSINSASVPQRDTGYEYVKKRTAGPVNKDNITPLTAEDVNGLIRAYGSTNSFPAGATPKQKAQIILSNEDAKNKSIVSKSGAGGSNTIVRVPKSELPSSGDGGKQFLGAPPDILYLTAYSSASNVGGSLNKTANLFRIPVVLLNYDLTWPNDVDYIPTDEGEPFPILMQLSLNLSEAHSPREFNGFDIFKFREGKLPGF